MALAFVAASSAEAAAQAGTDQSLTLPIPGTAGVGNMALVVVGVNSNLADYSLSTPTGWTVVHTQESGSQYGVLLAKELAVGEPGTNVEFTVTALTGGTGAKVPAVLSAYSDANVADSASQGHTSSTSHAIPSVNCPSLPALLVGCLTKKSSSLTTITEPAGFTSRQEYLSAGGGAIAVGIADIVLGSTGPAGGDTWTTDAASAAASTFSVVLTEGLPPAPQLTIYKYTLSGWQQVQLNSAA